MGRAAPSSSAAASSAAASSATGDVDPMFDDLPTPPSNVDATGGKRTVQGGSVGTSNGKRKLVRGPECEHGRKRCKECSGSFMCEHGRRRRTCKDCGGSGICEHGRVRYYCKDCGGSGICEHGRNRSTCKDCKGASSSAAASSAAASSAKHPVLFKNCISPDAVADDFIATFEDTRQNLFPPCEGLKLLRRFQFESYSGDMKPIIEDVPCDTSTLREKMDAFYQHKLFAEDDKNVTTHHDAKEDRSYFEVHTYMLNDRERARMDLNIKNLTKGLAQESLIENMLAATMTVFLHAGRSAVYYLHAHADHFLSFCLTAEKTWLLIDPMYSESFDSVWSGNAQIQLREKEPNVPRLIVKQEKGDILFVPPWWLHEVMVMKTVKNIGLNLHFGVRGQLTMELAHLFRSHNPSLFYSSVKKLEPELFKKKTRASR